MQTYSNYDCTPHFVHFVYRYTGKERDAESGNDYFGARYYSSAMGRFMSPDWAAKEEPVPYAKLDNPQTLNLYVYALNDQLSRVDADGHFSTATYDDKAKTITYRDKNGKVVGVYPANNNVQSKASIGRLQNGTHAPNPNDTTSAHTHGDATGAHGLKEDSKNGEYGTKGIVRLDTVTGRDGQPHDGVGIHAGREDQPDRAGREGPDAATNGCIRTTEDSMSTLTNLIKNDPLTGVTVQNSGQANGTSAIPVPAPTPPPTPEKHN
jgi:RHS repeat-associated protein